MLSYFFRYANLLFKYIFYGCPIRFLIDMPMMSERYRKAVTGKRDTCDMQ